MNSRWFIAGTGTDVGKTMVSSIFAQALDADYWKPVQTGSREGIDRETVKSLVQPSEGSRFHPEGYCLNAPLSPHAAAEAEGVRLSISNIRVPETRSPLVIEGAGGLLVPLNDQDLLIDLIPKFEAQVILVSRHALGSINSTLLSIEALAARKIPLAGMVFVGTELPGTEKAVLSRTQAPCLLHVALEPRLTGERVRDYAKTLSENLRKNGLV